MVIQGRSQPSPEQHQRERAARRILPARDPPITALTQDAAGTKEAYVEKKATCRLSQRLYYFLSPSLPIVSCFLLCLLSLFLCFTPLIRPLLVGFCRIAKVSRRLVIVTMGRFALLSLALASIFAGGLATVSLLPMRARTKLVLPLPCLILFFLHRRLLLKKLLPPHHL